jgi:hypothetical protein
MKIPNRSRSDFRPFLNLNPWYLGEEYRLKANPMTKGKYCKQLSLEITYMEGRVMRISLAGKKQY